MDVMRGMAVPDTSRQELFPNTSGVENGDTGGALPLATGFQVRGTNNRHNKSEDTYIYLAIRRSNKPPTSGTQVYNAATYTGDGSNNSRQINVSITPDLAFVKSRTNTYWNFSADRLRGPRNLHPHGSDAEVNPSTGYTNGGAVISTTGGFAVTLVTGTSATTNTNDAAQNYEAHAFRRAPGFFDVVCYTGTGSAGATVSHNLTTKPELIITRVRNYSGEDWVVHYSNGSSIVGGYLNSTSAFSNASSAPSTDITSLTSSQYTLNTSNRRVNAVYNYVAYLFATLAGISKVGSYTGNGSNQTINCGFAAGARFVLIKRTNSTGDWYVWDSARGIVAGNDPHLSLNTNVAEVTTDDSIDPDNTGFIVNQLSATNINVTSATYIYLAIA
jgi:hypothetical protein